MLKNNPGIFSPCETNLHDDIQESDVQLPGYLPIHRKDAGHMHSLGVYLESNLPIARETILEDENESYVFSFGSSTFYYLGMCLGLKHDATYDAKEITEWVEIGIVCYIPHRKFQLKPHSSPWFTPCTADIAHRNHYFHQYHRNATPENKKLFCDSRNHCKKVLKDEKSNYAIATRRSDASHLIGSRDFWRICNSVLNFMSWNVNSLAKENFQRVRLIAAHNSIFNYDLISFCETSLLYSRIT